MVEPQHVPLYQELSNRETFEYIAVLWRYACREIATIVSNQKKLSLFLVLNKEFYQI